MRGILIIALGHENYFSMAEVLAASIKVNEPELQVCVVTEGNREINSMLFDKEIVADPAIYTQQGKKEYIKAKLSMYDLSPFEETIFMDADQVMIAERKLSAVFDELKEVDFTFSNTGLSESSIWCEIEEVRKIYGDHPFWNYHSEFVYFKKSANAKKYFKAAKRVYEANKIKSAVRFANATMADELAFQCAGMITGMYPHKENWTPNFWFDRANGTRDASKYTYELDYITYSIGGNIIPQRVKNNYNTLAKYYFATLNLSNPYQVEDKKSFLPERMKM